MGLFDLVRRLDREIEEATRAAAAKAAELRGDHDAIAAFGWDSVDEPALLKRFYGALAESDPDVALAVSRIDAAASDDEAVRAIAADGFGPCAPYLAALLASDGRRSALRILIRSYDKIGRRLTGLETIAAGEPSYDRQFAVVVCSGSPYPEDRAIALDALRDFEKQHDADEDEPLGIVQIRCRLAEAGENSMDGWLIEQLERAVHRRTHGGAEAIAAGEPRYLSRDDSSPIAMIMKTAASRGLRHAAPLIAELLWSFDVHDACDALGELGGDDAIEALRDYRKKVVGYRDQVAFFHVPVDAALARLGQPADLELARWAMTELTPKRYGYPKVADVAALRTRAARTLVAQGTRDDRESLRSLARADGHDLRQVALDAIEKLDGERPTLRFCDKPAIERLSHTPTALLELLDDPHAVYAWNPAVAAMEIDETRDDAIRWARRHLESMPNYYADYSGDTGPGASALLSALGELERDDIDRLLAGTSSAWIEHFVIEQDDMTRKSPSSITGDAELSVSRFDGAEQAFVFGAHLNGIALSRDGSKFAVVGGEIGKICDARTGEQIARLDLRWNWGYDVAFSSDGERLLACYHGVHVETYDAATGERVHELEIPGAGVPDGSKRCAISPDDRLAVSVDSNGQVSCHDLATGEHNWTHAAGDGSYEAVAFTPDGGRLVASHVKMRGGEENYLTVHDPQTGDAERFDMPSSMWAVAFSPDGNTAAIGGEASRVRLCDPKTFEPRRTLKLASTTRLCFSSDGAKLYGCSKNGQLVVWDLSDEDDVEGTNLLSGEGPLWSVVRHPDGGVWAVGTQGTVFRFDGDDERVEIEGDDQPTGVHRKQVRWIEPGSERVLTAGWDGQLLSWPSDGGAAEVLWSCDRRINAVATRGDRELVLGTGEALVVVGRDGSELRRIDGDYDAVAVSADGTEIAVDERRELVVLDAETLAEKRRLVCGTDSIEAICALPDGWLVSTEQGEVSRVRDNALVWTRADHGAERLERGNPHKSVASLIATEWGYISGATDDTVRVYRWNRDGSAVLRARIHPYDFSLFSRMAVSPNGRFLAVPYSFSLEVFDLETGEMRFRLLTYERFEGQEACSAQFVDDETLLVGTENGGIFCVSAKGAIR